MKFGKPLFLRIFCVLAACSAISHAHAHTEEVPAACIRAAEGPRTFAPIADPTDPALVEKEINALIASGDALVQAGSFTVVLASSDRIPSALRELGRLREITFRAVGEGSGKELDLDVYDEWYLHLISWDPVAKRIVGAYRIGDIATIQAARGLSGLYTTSLFDYGGLLKGAFRHGLELGRSFVVADYQKHATALFSLWKGIFQYIAAHPEHKDLLGVVSTSNEYQDRSKQLLVEFLRQNFSSPYGKDARPLRTPRFAQGFSPAELTAILERSPTIEALSDQIVAIEPDGKKVPVLIRQYLKMGSRFLGFHFDEEFWTVDGLIHTDISALPPTILRRYMGDDAANAFLAYWAAPNRR